MKITIDEDVYNRRTRLANRLAEVARQYMNNHLPHWQMQKAIDDYETAFYGSPQKESIK